MACVGALLESPSLRPFKSSEEYVLAMKEDLAEWLNVLYPELRCTADNLLHRLDSGVVLCRHAAAVRETARELLTNAERAESAEALDLARRLRARPALTPLPAARPGTFFARDNLSNFIAWCRHALGVLECLLFETDDLCLRKNEKHVVLCLLEVARRGASLGMAAPLLVQMERQIERELAGEACPAPLGTTGTPEQIVTNDLRSLDERVRDLLARCTCPTQFPCVRVSEGKYRIGDTKLLIFVRILRSHVMVRVGGGWDTLQHYLDKHDPCRCRAQHRAALAATLRPRAPHSLVGATVTYSRALSPPRHPGISPPRQPASLPASLAAPPSPASTRRRSPRPASPAPPTDCTSDNGSEVSDEGYRSLGVPGSPAAPEPAVAVSTGLRRTQRSHELYGTPPPVQRQHKHTPGTWSGRSANRTRVALTPDTFRSPPRAPRPSPPPAPDSALRRGSPLRASCGALRNAGNAPKGVVGASECVASATNKTRSPLLEQILRSAGTAQDDATVLEQVKRVIRQYSATGAADTSDGSSDDRGDDFTAAWVMSDGRLERSASARQLAPRRRHSPRVASHAPPTRIPAPL